MSEQKSQKAITKREEDFSKWYLEIVEQAQLAESSAVRGCMVIKPYGYAIWEAMQIILDKKFKETGHENAYFPLLIPKSFLTKEAKHVEGFAQETAVVTHYRLKTDPQTKEVIVDETAKLDEPLVIRPTSETIIYDTFSRWVQSYRDLPILINQWANVLRWEMRTKPFIRTAEFLWQEGHTAHATYEEAEIEAQKMLGVYKDFAENYLAIPVIAGIKSESEKFAGALRTYTIEAMTQDLKAIQAGTSHNLGDNFAKAFDVKYIDNNGDTKYVWQTSWGLSTRMIGTLIMVHSDDKGLVLPPKIASIQAIIIPIAKTEEQFKQVLNKANELKKELENGGINVKIDERDYMTMGEKSYEWEKKGVPVRLELGPKDLEKDQVVIVRRDTSNKEFIPMNTLVEHTIQTLEQIQINLFKRAKQMRDSHIFEVKNWEEFKDVIDNQKGFVLAHFDGTPETEEKIKAETKATTRCYPLEQKEEEGVCIYSGKKSTKKILFAKAY
jgi:prolyl-tRNA synthetase